MPEPSPRLRVVGAGESPPRRGRGPGLAVILVGLYSLVFGAALWMLRGQARPARRIPVETRQPSGVPGAPQAEQGRDLLSGAALEPAARTEYLRQLATDCCDCGCDLTLHECLVADQKCARSAEMAEERRRRWR